MVNNEAIFCTRLFVKPLPVLHWRFFLNENIKEDFILLKSKSGMNAYLI